MENNTKLGQLLFPSISHADKIYLNKLERESGERERGVTCLERGRKKEEENKERERERVREGSVFHKFHIPLIPPKDNKSMTTKTTSYIVANAAMEKGPSR